jgi:beta-glucosidase
LKEQVASGAAVNFDAGTDVEQAAKVAHGADVAIVFVTQWMSEGQDALTLSLPDKQDALVEAVAKANPNTIVVLETGGPVSMPWSSKVKGIVEAWFPGIGGGEAIANVLCGRVNPSGKLPVTFAEKDGDLPHPHVTGLTERTGNNGMNGNARGVQQKNFTVDYNVEGMLVGYKWFQVKDKAPLFPFGFGLSYTSFEYSGLKVTPDGASVSFEVKNTGARAGDEVVQVYVTLPKSAGEPFRKLVGFKRVPVAAGVSEMVRVAIDPLYLKVFSAEKNGWEMTGGEYTVEVGGASNHLPLHEAVTLEAR